MTDESENPGVRFFLDQDQDQDSHWFVVPEALRAIWDAWCELDTDLEEAWEAPSGCIELGRHPNSVTFSNWRIE